MECLPLPASVTTPYEDELLREDLTSSPEAVTRFSSNNERVDAWLHEFSHEGDEFSLPRGWMCRDEEYPCYYGMDEVYDDTADLNDDFDSPVLAPIQFPDPLPHTLDRNQLSSDSLSTNCSPLAARSAPAFFPSPPETPFCKSPEKWYIDRARLSSSASTTASHMEFPGPRARAISKSLERFTRARSPRN